MTKPAIIALLLSTLCLSACACGESFPCNTGGGSGYSEEQRSSGGYGGGYGGG
jgi:hypothetical protein